MKPQHLLIRSLLPPPQENMLITAELDERNTRQTVSRGLGVSVSGFPDSYVPLGGRHLWRVAFYQLPQHILPTPTLRQGSRPVVSSMFPRRCSQGPFGLFKKQKKTKQKQRKRWRKEISQTRELLGIHGRPEAHRLRGGALPPERCEPAPCGPLQTRDVMIEWGRCGKISTSYLYLVP